MYSLHNENKILPGYSVPLRIQSECGKIRTRKTPNTDTVDSLYLDYPLFRISLYLEQNVRSLEISPKHCIAFPYSELLYLELFPISNKFSGPLNHFLSVSNIYIFQFHFRIPEKIRI